MLAPSDTMWLVIRFVLSRLLHLVVVTVPMVTGIHRVAQSLHPVMAPLAASVITGNTFLETCQLKPLNLEK